jgi:hypothetical protein
LLLNTCLRIGLDIVLVRNIVNAAEVLGSARDYGDAGIFHWTTMQLQRQWMRAGTIFRPMAPIMEGKPFLYLNGIQIFLSGLLIILPTVDIRLLWPVFVVEVLMDQRNTVFGRDGSDRMHIVVFFALCICYSFTDLRARSIGIMFIALEVMLAYFISGVVKAMSHEWRSGRSLALVLSSENYGAPRLGRWIEKNSRLCRVACWSVIAFEMLLPLFVLLGPVPAICVLLTGIFFHISVAATMGLNGFVWSFPAAYPAIVFFSFTWQQYVRHIRPGFW